MGRLIVKLTDPKDNTNYYMEWSTTVDAPVTNGMLIGDFKNYYKEEYGNNGYQDLEARLEQVEKTGCSSRIGMTLQDVLNSYQYVRVKRNNPLEEILKEYCRDQ